MSKVLIGVSGKIGSGKSTVASHLVDEHLFREIAFADKLKEICSELFDFDIDLAYEREGKKQTVHGTNLTVRGILQQVGSLMRNVHVDVWLDFAIREAKDDERTYNRVVFSDCRHYNEASRILSEDGYIISLTRNIDDSTHESELDIEYIREQFQGHAQFFLIDNEYQTLEETLDQVDLIVKRIMNEKKR